MPPIHFSSPSDSGRQYCWGCGVETGKCNGISLSGDTDDAGTKYELCFQCRDNLPVRDRIWLNMLLRSRDQGGLGAVEALESIVQIIRQSCGQLGHMDLTDYLERRRPEEDN